MPNGILVIDKPEGWTRSGHALAERVSAGAEPRILAGGSFLSWRTRFAGLRREDGRFCHA